MRARLLLLTPTHNNKSIREIKNPESVSKEQMVDIDAPTSFRPLKRTFLRASPRYLLLSSQALGHGTMEHEKFKNPLPLIRLHYFLSSFSWSRVEGLLELMENCFSLLKLKLVRTLKIEVEEPGNMWWWWRRLRFVGREISLNGRRVDGSIFQPCSPLLKKSFELKVRDIQRFWIPTVLIKKHFS